MSRTFLRCTIVLFCFVSPVLATARAAAQDLNAAELRQLGRVAFDQGNFTGAERLLRLSLEKSEAVETLADLSSVLMSQERFSEAEQVLNRAIAIQKTRGPESQRQTPILLGNLGTLYQMTGKTNLSEAK